MVPTPTNLSIIFLALRFSLSTLSVPVKDTKFTAYQVPLRTRNVSFYVESYTQLPDLYHLNIFHSYYYSLQSSVPKFQFSLIFTYTKGTNSLQTLLPCRDHESFWNISCISKTYISLLALRMSIGSGIGYHIRSWSALEELLICLQVCTWTSSLNQIPSLLYFSSVIFFFMRFLLLVIFA